MESEEPLYQTGFTGSVCAKDEQRLANVHAKIERPIYSERDI
jgi:hypothetical protein